MKQFKKISSVLIHGEPLFPKALQPWDHWSLKLLYADPTQRNYWESPHFTKNSHCCWSVLFVFMFPLLFIMDWVHNVFPFKPHSNSSPLPYAALLMYWIYILLFLCVLIKYTLFDKLVFLIDLNGLVLYLIQGFSLPRLHFQPSTANSHSMLSLFLRLQPRGFLE